MSLLENLITQVASQALNGNRQNSPAAQQQANQQSGGLGGILGSVLGSGAARSNTASSGNQVGLNDVLGSVIGSQMGSQAGAGGLGSILGSVLGANNQSQQRSGSNMQGMLIAALIPVVLNWIQKNGGLSGALNKVSAMGLDSQAQSWLSTQSSNQNLEQSQVQQLFDQSEIQAVAQQTGADESQVCQGLAQLLPEVINQLSPQGGMQNEAQANQEINAILSQLSSALK